MTTLKTGPRFVEPPRHTSRRHTSIDPGTLALIGAIVAIIFILIMAGILEAHLGLRLSAWFVR
jgi:hypothetical protein